MTLKLPPHSTTRTHDGLDLASTLVDEKKCWHKPLCPSIHNCPARLKLPPKPINSLLCRLEPPKKCKNWRLVGSSFSFCPPLSQPPGSTLPFCPHFPKKSRLEPVFFTSTPPTPRSTFVFCPLFPKNAGSSCPKNHFFDFSRRSSLFSAQKLPQPRLDPENPGKPRKTL